MKCFSFHFGKKEDTEVRTIEVLEHSFGSRFFTVNYPCTINYLKRQIELDLNISVKVQVLMFCGAILENNSIVPEASMNTKVDTESEQPARHIWLAIQSPCSSSVEDAGISFKDDGSQEITIDAFTMDYQAMGKALAETKQREAKELQEQEKNKKKKKVADDELAVLEAASKISNDSDCREALDSKWFDKVRRSVLDPFVTLPIISSSSSVQIEEASADDEVESKEHANTKASDVVSFMRRSYLRNPSNKAQQEYSCHIINKDSCSVLRILTNKPTSLQKKRLEHPNSMIKCFSDCLSSQFFRGLSKSTWMLYAAVLAKNGYIEMISRHKPAINSSADIAIEDALLKHFKLLASVEVMMTNLKIPFAIARAFVSLFQYHDDDARAHVKPSDLVAPVLLSFSEASKVFLTSQVTNRHRQYNFLSNIYSRNRNMFLTLEDRFNCSYFPRRCLASLSSSDLSSPHHQDMKIIISTSLLVRQFHLLKSSIDGKVFHEDRSVDYCCDKHATQARFNSHQMIHGSSYGSEGKIYSYRAMLRNMIWRLDLTSRNIDPVLLLSVGVEFLKIVKIRLDSCVEMISRLDARCRIRVESRIPRKQKNQDITQNKRGAPVIVDVSDDCMMTLSGYHDDEWHEASFQSSPDWPVIALTTVYYIALSCMDETNNCDCQEFVEIMIEAALINDKFSLLLN